MTAAALTIEYPADLEPRVPVGFRPVEPKVETGSGIGRVRQALTEEMGPVYVWSLG